MKMLSLERVAVLLLMLWLVSCGGGRWSSESEPVNLAPTGVSLSENSVLENETGASIGTVSGTDPDGDVLTFQLDGTDASSFALSGSTLSLAAEVSANFEEKSKYDLRLSALDPGGLTVSSDVEISVIDVNEPPLLSLDLDLAVLENQSDLLTSFRASDEDDPDDLNTTYGLAGSDAALFELSTLPFCPEGEACVQVVEPGRGLKFLLAPDFETPNDFDQDNVYQVDVVASDGEFSQTGAIAVTVEDAVEGRVVDAPLSDSEVCIDLNADSLCQDLEQVVRSDEQGFYNLPDATSEEGDVRRVVSIGGSDIITGKVLKSLAMVATMPTDPTKTITVTPVSTLLSATDNPDLILMALGFPEGVSAEDITSIDPWALATDSGENEDENALGLDDAVLDALVETLITASVQISNIIQTADAVVAETTNTGIQTEQERAAMLTSAVAEELVKVIEENVAAGEDTSLADSNLVESVLVGTVEESAAEIVEAIETKQQNGEIDEATLDAETLAEIIDIKGDSEVITQTGIDSETANSLEAISETAAEVNQQTQDIVESAGVVVLSDTATAEALSDLVDVTSDLAEQVLDGSLDIDDYQEESNVEDIVQAENGLADLVDDVIDNGVNSGTGSTNSSPLITSSDIFSAAENQTSIGAVTATDAEGDNLTYSLSGTDAGSLSISSSGVLSFNVAPDYETNASYSLIVTVSDGVNSVSQDLLISITDASDVAPVISSSSTFSAAENQTLVGTVTATDAEGDSLSYSLSGTDATSFGISSSGVLSFNTAPDYETKASYSVTVTVSDGVNSTTSALTIAVTNGDDVVPVISSGSSFSAAENQTSIGTVTATDSDSASISFTVSGSELVITSGGVLSFASAPDYETTSSYTATVTATDGANSTTQTITVSVTDVNDVAPVISSGSSFSAAENQTSVGTVTATDVEGDSLTYSINGSEIQISSAGVLTFTSAPDYETKSSYTATVTASDGTNATTQNITITVTDVDDVAPVFTSGTIFSAAENQTSIGTVTATDADSSSITFSVSGSGLAITSSGTLSFVLAPDYETSSSYTATVTATDGTNSTAQNITVSVTGVDDVAPVFSSSASFSASENQRSIGSVTATDVDTNNASITFSVSGSELVITSGGVLSFVSVPDYETKSSYTATVTATDGINSTTQAITVSVTEAINLAPVILNAEFCSKAYENVLAVCNLSGTDGNGDTLTFSLSGIDASDFFVESNSVLKFVSNPNYENPVDANTNNQYEITLNATDGKVTTSRDLKLQVLNVEENQLGEGSFGTSIQE